MLVGVGRLGRGVRGVRGRAALWLTLLALAVAGAADTFTVVFRGVIVQAVTPDELRGRVKAADYVVGAGGASSARWRPAWSGR